MHSRLRYENRPVRTPKDVCVLCCLNLLMYYIHRFIHVVSSVPDNLVDEVVRVLSGKHGESRPRRHTLLKADRLGVDREDGRLVHVLDRDGDPRCGLKRGLDAAGQVGLVGHHHGQHEGTIHLKINGLETTAMGRREGERDNRMMRDGRENEHG